MKEPILHTFDLNTKSAQKVLCVTHTDDNSVDVIQLHVVQNGLQVDLSGATITARMVMSRTRELLSDNVVCSIDETTNDIMIPIDNKVISMRKGLMFVEVNVRGVSPKTLTLQFPLLVRVNGSILETAHVTPESQGTIPELLEAVKEELERVQGYVDEEQVKNIIDGVLSGVTTNVPTLLIDNTVNQQYNPDGHLIWYYIDSDGARHNLFDFTPYLGGTEDYNDLENKPQISGVTLSGDKTPDELGLQKKLTIQESSGDDPKDYLFLRNNGYLGFNSQFVLSIQSSGFPKLSYWSSVNGVASITTSSIVSDGLTVGINGNIPVSEGGTYYRFCTNGETRKEIYLTNSGKAYQKLTTLPGGTWAEGQWQEIGGGFQIASGVVNQNGTISFYDTDGNLLFTTTGASVIGFSPTATVTQTQSGATVSITDKNGTTTANISNGADGQDYVLTAQDKTDIANIVLSELPTTEGVLYGD